MTSTDSTASAAASDSLDTASETTTDLADETSATAVTTEIPSRFARTRARLAPHFTGLKIRTAMRSRDRARKPALIAAATVIGVMVAVGGTFIAMSKTVTITVDGVASEVTTVSGTVEGALDAAGISVGTHDAIAPAESAKISDGSKIVLDRGRMLNVTLDGTDQHFWTTASTVAGAFDQMGVQPSDFELSVDSSKSIPLDGLAVTADTLHNITFDIEPAPTEPTVAEVSTERMALKAVPAVAAVQPDHIRTAAKTVGDLLADQGVALTNANRVTPSTDTPLSDGMVVTVTTLPTVELTVGADDPREVLTEATTVGDLLDAQHITLGEHDTVTPDPDTAISDGLSVTVDRVDYKTSTKTLTVDQPADETVDDSSMSKGTTEVVQEGHPGEVTVTYRTKVVNGTAGEPQEVSRETVTEAEPTVTHVGTYVAPVEVASESDTSSSDSSGSSGSSSDAQPSTSGGPGIAAWERIAQCESTNNWHINTGNGYYGGLQFDIGTWLANGGGKYAPRADLATKAQQIDIANNVYAHRGFSPWACAPMVGLG